MLERNKALDGGLQVKNLLRDLVLNDTIPVPTIFVLSESALQSLIFFLITSDPVPTRMTAETQSTVIRRVAGHLLFGLLWQQKLRSRLRAL